MSDNRTLAKGVMVGGVPVYNNVESTTDTTMPSTSFFKTEDVDGKPVIISRDNIMGIVKDCLGSILNGLSDQTTVTKVPTLNGDTLGASAVSTLASVLGVGAKGDYYTNKGNGSYMTVHGGKGYYICLFYEAKDKYYIGSFSIGSDNKSTDATIIINTTSSPSLFVAGHSEPEISVVNVQVVLSTCHIIKVAEL